MLKRVKKQKLAKPTNRHDKAAKHLKMRERRKVNPLKQFYQEGDYEN
jgi:hypothetical protein